MDSLITRCFPDLTRAQVYECLAYYEDHRGEIDALATSQMSPTRPVTFLFDDDVPDDLGHLPNHVGHRVTVLREVPPRDTPAAPPLEYMV